MTDISRNLRAKFLELLSHLNSEENEMATEFAEALDKRLTDAEDDSLWRSCLESGGVDNWSWYSESLKDGGYYADEEDEEDDD